MKDNEIEFINYYVSQNLGLLNDLREKNFNNQSTEDYNIIVRETRNNLISIIETYLLKPEESIEPVKKIFKTEDESTRIEIRQYVNEQFTHVK